MVLSIWQNPGGAEGWLHLLFIKPFKAFFYATLGILVSLLIGLPIRLRVDWQAAWIRRQVLAILGFLTGLFLMGISLHPAFIKIAESSADNNVGWQPNPFLGVFGWLLLSFSILHFYPTASQWQCYLRYRQQLFGN